MASPVVVAQLVQYVIGVSSLMFVGHLGEAKLAAAGLATTVGNVTGLSVLIGLGSGLDSLCGQAYGAGDLKLVGEHAARGLVVLTIPALLISVLWLNSEFLLAHCRGLPALGLQVCHGLRPPMTGDSLSAQERSAHRL